ncbi:hypothetical protein HF1_05380 [Mycoplasma haemofelis str. Langford 1]|uniref:Uncharacterized protein n=1 Tax=Mycoplasma haemofelis (strain Langford 1) TaxID=941640 RepID=E8ZHC5_MYCHL|nr:hypothetical protein [Mycoplasma haemofelis]CBY92546.1 hypothetical protein HF1_05380 [Mycoplasma haemofelis str. Langford 1]
MELLGSKFLLGGATAASAAGLGAVGASAFGKGEPVKETVKSKEASVEPEKTEEITAEAPTAPEAQVQQKPACRVFKITNKETNPQFSEVDWKDQKNKDTEASTTNQKFWEDVDNACNGTGDKKSVDGKVYVTQNGKKWNYSGADQKVWAGVPQ